jgi:hypothetical protein
LDNFKIDQSLWQIGNFNGQIPDKWTFQSVKQRYNKKKQERKQNNGPRTPDLETGKASGVCRKHQLKEKTQPDLARNNNGEKKLPEKNWKKAEWSF